MKYVVVYNPRSGTALSPRKLRNLFASAGLKVEAFIDITKDFDSKIDTYTSQSTVVIACYGGDGTISSTAAKLVNKKAVLAPLPGGTLNHFTKDLNIPQDLAIAIKQLRTAKVTAVDTASVNDRFFINNSSIGLYPTSLTERSKLESKLGKWPAAVLASLRALIRFRLYTVSLNRKTYKTPFIFVGNNRYDADSLFERKSLNRGVLSVHMIAASKRSVLVKIFFLALIGRAKSDDNFISFTTDSLELKVTRPKITVSYDGEHAVFSTPVKYQLHKKALKVLL